MIDFHHRALPWNVRFAVDATEELPAELDGLGLERALVLSTAGHSGKAATIVDLLGERAGGLFAGARMHVPRVVVDEAAAVAREIGADCTVALGGGSTIGLGKALALEVDLANVAIPTTYAGSEMTDIVGITEDGIKRTQRTMKVVPDLVIYDPRWTLTMPARLTAVSGLNAMAQAVANVVTPRPDPVASLHGVTAIRTLTTALTHVVEHPDDLTARERALLGAWHAGCALGLGSTGLHHRICHVLGGTFGTSHAETHAVMLPHTVAFAARRAPEAARTMAEAMAASDAALAVWDLGRRLETPRSLREIGLAEEALAEVEERVVEDRPELETARGELRNLLHAAFEGQAPLP